jgi:uncharacterized membrane protein YoaK (UPF0700 family)
MAIGGAFTSVITGNVIFVGRAVGTSSLSPALHVVMSIVGYITGVALGSRLVNTGAHATTPSVWPQRATLVLALECLVLLISNVAWIAYRADPPAIAVDFLLVAAAASLGMQGAAARTVAGAPSTTYMTGALTTLVASLSMGRPRRADAVAAVGLLALVAGAACGAVLVERAPRIALLPAFAAVALVVVIKLRHHLDGRQPRRWRAFVRLDETRQ